MRNETDNAKGKDRIMAWELTVCDTGQLMAEHTRRHADSLSVPIGHRARYMSGPDGLMVLDYLPSGQADVRPGEPDLMDLATITGRRVQALDRGPAYPRDLTERGS